MVGPNERHTEAGRLAAAYRFASGTQRTRAWFVTIGVWLLSAGWMAFGQQYPFLPVPGSPKDGKAIFQDSRGRLWIAGDQLACFDGNRFFFLRDYGFPAVTAFDVTEDPSGAIWIGAETGVYRFSNGHVEEVAQGVAVSVIAATPDTAVAAVGPLGRGVPADTALIRIQRRGASWKTETVMSLDSPGPLTLDRSGTLLYPWTILGWSEIRLEDVVRWRPGMHVAVTHHGEPGDPVNGGWKILRDRFGCVWGQTPRAVGYNCGDGPGKAPFDGAEARTLHEGTDGNMVVLGDSLLATGRPGSFQMATRANGLPGLVDGIAARDGTVWLTTTNGLYRFASPFRIESWTIREGLPDPPWSVARVGHSIFVGMDRRIAVLTKDRLRWDTIARFKDGGLVSGLLDAGDGTLIAAFIDGGAFQLRRDGRIIARTEKDKPIVSMRLARTTAGEIWLGGRLLGQLTRAGPVLQFAEHPLQTKPAGNVLAIRYEDHTRRLWACYNGGLLLRDDRGAWREFTIADGLQTNGCWSLAPLPNGDLWYAYRNLAAFALIRLQADGHIAVRQWGPGSVAQPASATFDLDRDNRLWRSGELGVFVAEPAQAEAGLWLQLDQSDGLPANDMNTGSVFADSDGSMWWGADNDLAHYIPPADLVSPRFAPQVFVSAFSWDNQPPKLAEAVDALPHGSKVVVHIGSLQFERRNALRIRYRLLPGQPSWRETKDLDVALGSLSSGAHTLEVEGRVFTGPWSPTARRSFTILRPVWQTWPLLLVYAATGMLLAGFGHLLYRRRQAEVAALLPDLTTWYEPALTPDIHELTGTLLDGRFEVGPVIEHGGFATVLDGHDRAQNKRCAIKVFRRDAKGDDKSKARIQRNFKQEVAALEQIHHPHVVSIYGQGAAPSGLPYLVMEFIDGETLRQILQEGPLSRRRTGRILRQIAGALDAIHAHGICHRDLKPENIMIRNAGSAGEAAVLIDFSIAIIQDAYAAIVGLSRGEGSFHYMPLEQAVGHASPGGDIHSLAKVVIEMLTGQRLAELLPGVWIDLPDRVPALLRSLPVHLSEDSILQLATALAFDPAQRPDVASHFAETIVRDLESDGCPQEG